MAAMAIEKTKEVSTEAIREGLEDLSFDQAPQGTVTMRKLDHQLVVPSYLMRVREGWTSVNDMFEEVMSVPEAIPLDARCEYPLK
jgi:hypothetical protein